MTDPVAPPTPENDPTPDVPKASWLWIKDTAGYPSVTVTFATVAFWVTTVLYVLGAIGKIGPVTFKPFDVAATSAYFIPILSLYFGRRWTDSKTQQITATINAGISALPKPPQPPTVGSK